MQEPLYVSLVGDLFVGSIQTRSDWQSPGVGAYASCWPCCVPLAHYTGHPMCCCLRLQHIQPAVPTCVDAAEMPCCSLRHYPEALLSTERDQKKEIQQTLAGTVFCSANPTDTGTVLCTAAG